MCYKAIYWIAFEQIYFFNASNLLILFVTWECCRIECSTLITFIGRISCLLVGLDADGAFEGDSKFLPLSWTLLELWAFFSPTLLRMFIMFCLKSILSFWFVSTFCNFFETPLLSSFLIAALGDVLPFSEWLWLTEDSEKYSESSLISFLPCFAFIFSYCSISLSSTIKWPLQNLNLSTFLLFQLDLVSASGCSLTWLPPDILLGNPWASFSVHHGFQKVISELFEDVFFRLRLSFSVKVIVFGIP